MTQTYIGKTLLQFMKRIKEIKKAWQSKKDGALGLWYVAVPEGSELPLQRPSSAFID